MASNHTATKKDLAAIAGVSEDSIQKNINRGRGKGIWKVVKIDGINQIDLRTIPDAWKAAQDLPMDNREIIRILAERKEELATKQRARNVDSAALCVEQLLSQMVEDSYMKHISYYHEHYTGQNDKARQLAKEHALRLAVATLRTAGYSLKNQLHPSYLCLSDNERTVRNYTKFTDEVKLWGLEGVNLVHGHKGKARPERCKLIPSVVALIEEYYKHPNQYGSSIITEMVNKACTANGWQTVSARTVRLYLERPEVRNRLMLFRNKTAFKKTVQATTRRKDAFYAGDLYYMDGSPLQIPCEHPTIPNKAIRPTLFAVMDNHSREIVGFAITPTGEDRIVWIDAMKMACDLKGFLPAEWVYDNASATGTEEFKTLKRQMEAMGCMLNPAKKGNPQAKANLERWFDAFQNGYQRLIDGFLGEGIMSRRDNARIDAEWLQRVKKVNGLLSYDTLVELVVRLISAYNQRKTARRAAPAIVFAQSAKPNAIALSTEKLATLFWKSKTIKVANAEIKMTVRGIEYFYEVYEHHMALALAGQQVKVYYDEKDLSQVHIFTQEGDYIAELRQKTLFAAAKVNQSANDVAQIIKQTSHNKAIETVAKRQTKQVIDAVPEALINVLNPLEALKNDFNNSETDLLLRYLGNSQSLDTDRIEEYIPVEVEPVAANLEANAIDYSTKFMKPATLKVVGERPR